MSKCKYVGFMKALDDYGMEFDYLQCMAQTDEIDYHYFGDDYECGFNDDYEDCPIYRLKNKIDKAIEYMKPRFMNCIDNDKRYFEDNDIQEIYEILGGKEQ